MKTVTVKISKLAGETGLKKPGTLVNVGEDVAHRWIRLGIAILIDEIVEHVFHKERKHKLETKEEKFRKGKQTK